MKGKSFTLTMLLLFMGMGHIAAQSVSAEQMDERFNDGTKLPYGWFTEGWSVKDGVIQTKSSSSSFDISTLFNGGSPSEDPEKDPEKDPGSDPEEDPEEEPGGGFNIADLLSSLMGGDSKPNYLLTPPLVVNEGETLVFSARKDGGSGSGSFDLSSIMGGSDSTFVVERTVYSQNKWVRVADFTTTLDTIFKTFTITDTPAGEYRFRFKAGGTVMIDSIAGFHFDSEAPDIYVVENDVAAKDIDFSLCMKDSTRTLSVINTATGTLKVAITSDDEALFSVGAKELQVAGGDTLTTDVTFLFAAGKPGKNEAQIGFTPADERVYGKSVRMMAVVTQPDVWVEDFNAGTQPKGFLPKGWEFHDGVATVSNGGGGIAAMFGGGGSDSFLMTPPLTVESVHEVLLFSVKSGSGNDGMAGLGSLFGGGSSSIVVEKSVYGSSKWEKVREFTEALDSTYRTLWVSYIEPGEYRFRIVASDSIVVDSIAGFHIDNNAPDMYVTVRDINYGMPQAQSTQSIGIINTGTGSLQVGVKLSEEKAFALSGNDFAIESGDTATVNVTFLCDEGSLGEHKDVVTITPTTSVILPLTTSLTAYSTYADAWSEDFEPEFIPEDETLPLEMPIGWETTGWEVTLPSSGGGLMDMLGGLMGGGGDAAPKTWAARTESDEYELITPRLQATKGDVLRFQVEMGGGGLMDMLGMFMGGAAGGGALNVFYSRDTDDNWTLYNTFTQSGLVYFVAPYTGVYQLRFTSKSASLDNFLGFHEPIEEIGLYDGSDNTNAEVLEKYNGQTVNVSYDRVLSAEYKGNGSWTPKAYTVCLPYDLCLSNYMESGKVKLYKLSYIDNYYKQFIFTEQSETITAGRAYLAVVEKGDVSLNAYNVTLTAEPVPSSNWYTTVNDYETWYFENNLTKVGEWLGTFRSIADTEADALNMYCVRDDGSWARFQSDPEGESCSLNGFRAYFLASESTDESNAPNNAPSASSDRPFRTMLQPAAGNVQTSENGKIAFNGDIPYRTDEATGIHEMDGYSIQTIDADGIHRYFDLQGRMLSGKPMNGIFINNGKKLIISK